MIDSIATRILEEDHRVILKVITRMAAVADDLDRGKAVEPAVLQQFLEFFRVFVEQAHYQKEESALFAALEKIGVPTSQPLVMLRNEHKTGRELLTELAHSVSVYISAGGAGRESLAKALHRIGVFYPRQIWTEDYWLLPVANKWLSSREREALAEEFYRIETEISPDLHRRFEQIADKSDCAVRA